MPDYIETPIEKEMQDSYIDYAMSVIVGRALPDARDGLKPAQRRTLYAMYKINNVHNQPTKKSARVVGEILGKYHPHGDVAVYDTLVRMAQDFSMNHMLVEGQGNMGCFTKDTKIRLTDGRSIDFEQLIEEQSQGKRHWTFTFNTKHNIVEITEIKNPRLTRKSAELVEVTLDNNQKIRCTPDHRFLLRDGTYRQAKDLKNGCSLMPLYTKFYDGAEDKNLKGYEILLQSQKGNWQFVHHLSDEWNINNKIYVKAAGRVRHHIDFNKRNNNPSNIIRMDWKEHWVLHYTLASWRHKNDPEYVIKLAAGREKYISEHHQLFSNRLAERNRRNWKNSKYRARHIKIIKALWKDKEYKSYMAEISRRNLKRLWLNESYRALMSDIKSKEMKKRWQEEDYQIYMSKLAKNVSNKLWSNPEHRKHISEVMKGVMNSPEQVEKSRRRAKALWEDTAYASKYSKEHFSEMAKKAWTDEEYRTK
ncbi:DNA gyrase, A subunit, partial [mine drainage metagenome]